jgi:hypothetical protein
MLCLPLGPAARETCALFDIFRDRDDEGACWPLNAVFSRVIVSLLVNHEGGTERMW